MTPGPLTLPTEVEIRISLFRFSPVSYVLTTQVENSKAGITKVTNKEREDAMSERLNQKESSACLFLIQSLQPHSTISWGYFEQAKNFHPLLSPRLNPFSPSYVLTIRIGGEKATVFGPERNTINFIYTHWAWVSLTSHGDFWANPRLLRIKLAAEPSIDAIVHSQLCNASQFCLRVREKGSVIGTSPLGPVGLAFFHRQYREG